MNFPSKLKELRLHRKWSQNELGERLGVSQSQITDYERGLKFPSTDTLIKLAQTLDVSLDYLVGLSSNKNMFDGEELAIDPDLLRITNKVRPKLDGIPVSDQKWELINDFLASVLKQEKKRLRHNNDEV